MKTKNLIYTLIAITLAVNVSYGQQPYQMTDTSNKWFEYGQYGGWGPNELQLVRLTYFFDGDTIINALSYKKLMHDRRDTIYYTPPFIQNSYGYSAAFRQDSLKVYFIMKDSTTEKLYCDFDLSIGDTLKYYYNDTEYIVDSISSIPFGTGTRKRYILNNGFSFYEGIGNALGLLRNFSIEIEGGVYLVCFEQSGITQYVSVIGANIECGLATTSINENVYSSDFTIFPNPFSTLTTFQTDKIFKGATLTVYNSYGQTVKQIKNINGQTITLHRDNLSSGLYFIRLTQDSKVITADKLVITD